MIQLFKPVYPKETADAVCTILNSGWTGLGPQTQEFEVEFANYVRAKYAVAFNSGTAALKAALNFLPPSSKLYYVITSPLTFISAVHVIDQEYFTPLFADIEPATGNIDPNSIESLCKEHKDHIAAVIVTHYGGQPVDLDAIHYLSGKYGFRVIEDAAHACGARYQGNLIGGTSEFCCFSFQSVKNLAIGDGGMVTTDNEEARDHMRKWRWCGIDKSTADRTGSSYSWDYNVPFVGEKAHMNDIMAAIGLVQLAHLEEGNMYRRLLVSLYYNELHGIEGITLLPTLFDRLSSCHLMPILVDKRDLLMERLKEKGIQTGVHYRPAYYYPMYKQDSLPNVEEFFRKELSLPLHLELTPEDVNYICKEIKEAI
jgi:perosamine synthetase